MELKNLKITIEIENVNCEETEATRELTRALDELNTLNKENKGKETSTADLLNMANGMFNKLSKDSREAAANAFKDIFKIEPESKPEQNLFVFEGPINSGKQTLTNEILEELGSPVAIDLRTIDEKSFFKFSKCEKDTKLIILREYEIPFCDDGNLNLNIKVEKKGCEPFDINPDIIILTDTIGSFNDKTKSLHIFKFPMDDVGTKIVKKYILSEINKK